MTATSDYTSMADARASLAAVLDAAAVGGAVTIGRRGRPASAVVDAEQLRAFLARSVPSRAQVLVEDDGFVLLVEGSPFVSEGATLDDAVADMILALREYAEDWVDHLHSATNHEQSWGLVNLVRLSDDAQLADWLAA
ncbi:type II toxin-antitoxin system prevent-host-death family antitoxin [Demequina salsinemoris]|uniref:type II toxin-antitoxin system prevent-host-death family antitoxin n=1 Tax=Demequina salsinemoris TaxID=577470 RepID=UPI0007844D57|nr:type II toxin-antitoxin system prevent-host-death family antitoxin [Demequina salsinemoris]